MEGRGRARTGAAGGGPAPQRRPSGGRCRRPLESEERFPPAPPPIRLDPVAVPLALLG